MNSLIIGLGSNIGDRTQNLDLAKSMLQKHFELLHESCVYESSPVDYEDQGSFLNQILEFKIPKLSPLEVLKITQNIETRLGRIKTKETILKGPRVIDIDIIFFKELALSSQELIIPHPKAFERSFVIIPLSELQVFTELQKKYALKTVFENQTCILFKE